MASHAKLPPPSSRGSFWCIECQQLWAFHTKFSCLSSSLVRITADLSFRALSPVSANVPSSLALSLTHLSQVCWVPVFPSYHCEGKRFITFSLVLEALFVSLGTSPESPLATLARLPFPHSNLRQALLLCSTFPHPLPPTSSLPSTCPFIL